jgi:hypothetical protein
MDIEALGVAAVKAAIAKTDYLVDYIKDKDKEPMWDGSIYAYSSKRKSNADWLGKSAVQIKGKSLDTLDVVEIKYDIEVVDLKNYKKEGGLLFFVVGIDDDGNTKIFYKALTPYLINKILEEKEEQGTVRVSFDIFPMQKNEICNVVMDFIRDAKKQELFTHDKILALEEFLNAAGKDISFGFQCSGIGYDINEPYKYLFNHETYMYAQNTKLNITFPIEHIHRIERAGHSVSGTITIAGKVYYDRYQVVHNHEGLELHIGKSIMIDFIKGNNVSKINYKLKGNIKEQIQDIQFIVDLIEKRLANINGIDFPIKPTDKELESFHIEDAKQLQQKLIVIDDMLSGLGVTKALEISNISAKEDEYLRMLITAFVENKSIRFKEGKVPSVGGISIGNVHLILRFRQMEDGSYLVENFPKAEYEVSGEYKNGKMFPTSKYVIMKTEDLMKADNIQCKSIVDELFLYENDGHYFNSNFLLLELIKAYDQTKEEVFLHEATRLAEWLRKAECLEGISIINYLQCIARQSGLSEEQEAELVELLEQCADNEQMKAGIHILLGNYKMANRCLDKLDMDKRKEFCEFPIYTLME